MKNLIIAFICGSLLSSGILITLKIGNNGSHKLTDGIKAVKQEEGTQDSFKIYHLGNCIFDFTVVENGFYLLVREDNLLVPRLVFKKLNQHSDKILYSLRSNRVLEDGSQLIVDHDMETGEIRTSIHWDGSEMKAYDKNGNLMKTDVNNMNSLNLRRQQLSEALKREGNRRE